MPIDPTLTNLSGKDMSNRDLRGVSFARMRLMRANFSGCDLRGCDFREADCTGAEFTCAQLEGADFTDAIIDGVTASVGVELMNAAKPSIPPIPAESTAAMEYLAMRGKIEALTLENEQLHARIAELEEANAEQGLQLDDALAEIRRLQQQPALEYDIPTQDVTFKNALTRRRRSNKSNG